MDSSYRYQLERYRGRSTRHVCPQCHRKGSFTRYIDTHNNNEYINDNVGKCNRLDKCGYHYTPKQYYADNPWKRDDATTNSGSLRPCGYHYTPKQYYADNPWKRDVHRSLVHYDRENERVNGERCRVKPTPRPIDTIPEWIFERSRSNDILPDHVQWLVKQYGAEAAEEVLNLYEIGATKDGHAIFWQRDGEDRLRTGKIMAYDTTTGHRLKATKSISWVHSELKRVGKLPEEWQLSQCLYGEHLLSLNPTMTVALVEAYKTAHVGAIVMPDYLWLACDSMSGLTAERLAPLKGRSVILFPDEGKGFKEWTQKIEAISRAVGFDYVVSSFVEQQGIVDMGGDIADLMAEERSQRAEPPPPSPPPSSPPSNPSQSPTL